MAGSQTPGADLGIPRRSTHLIVSLPCRRSQGILGGGKRATKRRVGEPVSYLCQSLVYCWISVHSRDQFAEHLLHAGHGPGAGDAAVGESKPAVTELTPWSSQKPSRSREGAGWGPQMVLICQERQGHGGWGGSGGAGRPGQTAEHSD